MRYVIRPIGANAASLHEIEARYLVVLPDDLKQFMLQSDGPNLWFEFKELQFLSTDEILGEDIYNLNRHMPGALPVCFDGNGNLCVARIEAGKVVGYFAASCGNLSWDDAVKIAQEFSQFLNDPVSPERRLYP